MSDVDPAYAQYLEKDYAEEARKAQEIAFANQVNQLGQLKATSPQPVPKAEYLELPERELPSTALELRQELEAAIANYHQAIENAKGFEAKLREARKAEAIALTDDSNADEKRIVKAVSESQGLQSVFSRRLELAKRKVPEAFAEIPHIARGLVQNLVNRCFALAAERAARHREVLWPRFDSEAFIRTVPTGFPVSYENGLDRLISCCPDVIAARSCIPRLNYLSRTALPAALTFEQLQGDLTVLAKAEEAFQIESNRQYNFEALAEVETEPQLVEA
jgi:hypothetical protein